MDKKSLVEQLHKAVRGEEMATRAYINHLRAITTRFEVPPENMAKVKKIMDTMILHDNRHRQICEKLLAYVKERNCNDF